MLFPNPRSDLGSTITTVLNTIFVESFFERRSRSCIAPLYYSLIYSTRSEKMDTAKLANKPQFKRGDNIVRSWPWSYVVHDEFVKEVCHACFYQNRLSASGEPLETKRLTECPKCKFCRYCSPECQLADRKHHELECQYLQSIRNSPIPSGGHRFPPEPVRHLARVIFRLQRGEVADHAGDCVPPPEGGDWKFTDLMSHAAEIKGSPRMAEFLQIERILQGYLKGNKYFESLTRENLLEIYGRLASNSFNSVHLAWNAFTKNGTVLCIGISKFDHDCEPNACRVLRDGGEFHIIAIKDIDRFDQVRLAYIDVLQATDARQELLTSDYHFTCTCRMCSSVASKPHHDDYLRSIRCAHIFDKKGRPIPRRVCTHPCPVDKEYTPLVERCEAGHLQQFPKETLMRARKFAEQTSEIIGQSNFSMFRQYIHHYNQKFLDPAMFAASVLDNDQRASARQIVLEALEGFQKFVPDSVDYAWQCCLASSILLKRGYVQDAEKVFSDNLPLLKLLFGENGESVAAMKEWFDQARPVMQHNLRWR